MESSPVATINGFVGSQRVIGVRFELVRGEFHAFCDLGVRCLSEGETPV